MKLKASKQVHYDSGPNMTPLVDVVMVILIFLMLAGSFGGAEHYLLSTTPITKGGVGNNKSDLVPDDTTFMITVDCPSPDRFVASAGDLRTGDMPTLMAALSRKLQQFEAAGTKADKVQVVVAPGRNTKYKFLIGVYQAASQVGFTKVSFAHSH